MKPELALAHDLASYRHDPLGCALYSFPWGTDRLADSDGPREWQREIMQEIGEHLRSPRRHQPLKIGVASGRGIGKSALIGMVSHWAMSTCDDCRAIVTANTEPQLATKLWPEINKWFRAGVNAHWWDLQATAIVSREKGHHRSWRLDRETWSENNTEAFQGLHNLGRRILVVFDEASGIADKVWEATEGSLTDEQTEIIWLAFGNPTRHSGRFRQCFGSQAHRWKTRQIDSRNVPGTNLELFRHYVEDFGEDSDFVRVQVRGEFPRAASGQFISQQSVNLARNRIVADQSKEPKIMAVDVARYGDDRSVIGLRQGQKFELLMEMRGMDTAQTALRVMTAIREHNPRLCVIDGDGVGGGVVDFIHLQFADWMKKHPWFRIQEFHGAATPGDKFMWVNKRAEVWGRMREWLKSGSIPDRADLEADLTGVEYFHSSKNQIQLERKDDMKARGMASPDLGDCLAYTFAGQPLGETMEERVARKQAAITDPMELFFAKMAETERRMKLKQPMQYWE